MNKLCKKLISILVLTYLCAGLFAHGGMLSGEKKLRLVKTKWFDIIYPERCEASAAILYEKADRVYDEVTAQYGLTPVFRMPVVITPAVDQFNAFWTAVPYNHIAIYDTGSSGASELAVFSETLLSTFRHELTHAVTFNMKNGFWRVMGKVFGDEFAPGMLAVTTGMAEGATVVSESAAGEGRLNDEYAKHYVKQAKIEDKFPSYHDVSGAADVSPGGSPYYFNGAFHGWLQEKYGIGPYAEFWYRVVNGKNLTISGAFKKSFGIKLKKAWEQFEAEYEVPQIAENPVRSGEVQDFFEASASDYSKQNNTGALYESLSVDGAAEKLIWYDRYGGRVFMADSGIDRGKGNVAEVSKEAPSHTQFHPLFSLRGLTAARLSNDGRFIAVSYLSENSPAVQARVKIYDLDTKSFFSVKDSGLKEAAILEADGDYYLIAQKYKPQRYSIAVYKIGLSSGKSSHISSRIRTVEPYAELLLDTEAMPYAFTPLEDGRFAWLKKERMNYSLCISSPDCSLLGEFAFPKGMTVRSLSAAGAMNAVNTVNTEKPAKIFYFSYAQKATLPRAGRLELTGAGSESPKAELFLSEKDISGGIFEPVFWKGKLVYIGEFYRQNRLLCIKEEELRQSAAVVALSLLHKDDTVPYSDTLTAEDIDLSSLSRACNPFAYFYRGIVIPFSRYTSDSIGPEASEALGKTDFLPGLTYITGLPWTSGSTGLYTLTSGYNIEDNILGISLTVNEGMDTSLFQTRTEVKSEFNSKGWKQGGATIELSTSLGFGRFSKITLSNTSTAIFGRDLRKEEKLFYNIEDIVSFSYSNAHKAGPGRFENTGFVLSLSYGGRKDKAFTGNQETYVDLSALTGAVKLYIPHLLPFESKYGMTCNLPLTLGANILPISSTYSYASFGYDEKGNSTEIDKNAKNQLGRVVFDAKAELLVFSLGIQKALPGITALYLNDFYIATGYAATGTAGSANYGGFQTSKLGEYFKAVVDGRGYYIDTAYLKTAIEFTPNIGVFAKAAYKICFYSIYSYTINSLNSLKLEDRMRFSFGFDMNF